MEVIDPRVFDLAAFNLNRAVEFLSRSDRRDLSFVCAIAADAGLALRRAAVASIGGDISGVCEPTPHLSALLPYPEDPRQVCRPFDGQLPACGTVCDVCAWAISLANSAVQAMDGPRVARACERLADACLVAYVVADAQEPRSPKRSIAGVDCSTGTLAWLPRPRVLQRIGATALVDAVARARGC
ncbi:MAG TPA: hypothetical protein VF292_03970 [Rhodanobacteraceae bacterium]